MEPLSVLGNVQSRAPVHRASVLLTVIYLGVVQYGPAVLVDKIHSAFIAFVVDLVIIEGVLGFSQILGRLLDRHSFSALQLLPLLLEEVDFGVLVQVFGVLLDELDVVLSHLVTRVVRNLPCFHLLHRFLVKIE